MRLLLDTCTLLWFVDDSEQLSPRARRVLDDEANEVFVSVASFWEIIIKVHKGKLSLPSPPAEWFAAAVHPDAVLPIEAHDVVALDSLGPPVDHRDPFDRLLVATALRRGMAIVTSDTAFSSYDVPIEW
ncbi:MAG: type II toxin-antitoxin system VapC family toxin [Myxococcota bacterium]